MKARLTVKQRKFIEAYLGPAEGSHTKAAKLAGYAKPSEQGSRLLRLLEQQVEEARANRLSRKPMTAEEVLSGLEDIARDLEHRSRYDALVALAKHHGLIDNKKAPEDRKVLETGLNEMISGIQRKQLPVAKQSSVILVAGAREQPES